MEEEHIIQQVVPVYVLELNNKVCIQWATKLWDDNTTTNITLKVSYTSFYIIVGFQWGTNGGNAYKNGYCLVSKI